MKTIPSNDVVLRISDLGITLAPTERSLLQACSFEVRAGERLTLIGESGAGKSLLAQAIMGTLPPVMRVQGEVTMAGRATNGQRQLTQPLWGHQVVMLPQEPWTALNPIMRLRTQVAEAGHYATGQRWQTAHKHADQHLAALGLAHAGHQWLHQVSGGMAQRVGVACASQGNAPLLIADEPTKGLDAGACEQVASLLGAAQLQGQALLTITHDLDLALRLGGRVAVMRHGQIVEQGDVQTVLSAPQHPYTQALLAAQPRRWTSLVPAENRTPAQADPLVGAQDLSVNLGGRAVLRHASLRIHPGDFMAVVGSSGCGKTTLGNALVGLLKPSSGQVNRRPGLAPWRFQKLYQDPVASFSMHQTIRQALAHLLRLHRLDPAPIAHWQQKLRLNDELLDRLPSEVSGGELQRLAILRAMLLKPVFVFADEPTSRLDALTQRDTMEALCGAMADTGCAMLLVSHDVHLAQHSTHQQWHIEEGRLHPDAIT
ncbi:peptide/nickel transport system ATP-binding protein [Hydrogenophaga palleronii]|uniref:Peptide/nickel transport system ATP-binding protein n=1 Tax=Hydrogenophaga palleronii TaxID=65655 RepID=A0ABU1WGC9_9BURK|nr:ATP-binding cassette domain-containing protein [Hydrogenophaga palleronii]MDR7148332.1 peptide/nickel transport system ATP-binding protein [Hydrogenophaga palleronii]